MVSDLRNARGDALEVVHRDATGSASVAVTGAA
jgi:hypothetical protein